MALVSLYPLKAAAESFEENKEVLDLAFTLLPPEAAFSIEAHGVS